MANDFYSFSAFFFTFQFIVHVRQDSAMFLHLPVHDVIFQDNSKPV